PTVQAASQEALPFDRADGNSSRTRRGALSRVADQQPCAGGLARFKGGVRTRTGVDARRRFDPDRERFQKDPRRRHASARPRLARRQRAFTERKVQPRLLCEGTVDERLSVAGTQRWLKPSLQITHLALVIAH